MTTLSPTRTLVGTGSDPGQIGSLVAAGVGALFGLAGFLAVAVGDDLIALDLASVSAALLAAAGLVAAVFVRDYPGFAAIGMALAPTAYVIAFGDRWSSWWVAYQAAAASGGTAENAFWSAMPALALFALSGGLLALAAILAAFDVLNKQES